ERTLALAVGGVGELIFAGADQVHGVPAESTSTRTPAARFHAGMLAPHPGLPGQAPSYLVRMDALVDELLAALTPVEAAHE
ncbi:MAG TPA: hypothetical protein VFW76_10430, partial [Ktedonobacterales bacterium]|nr:hypothetical protein [Ktedonobacterales bacterium]